jgi:hypothetical protein
VSGIAIYDLVQIAAPEITLNSTQYQRHQSNAAFRNSYHPNAKNIAALSEEEITKRRQESYAFALNAERRAGWQSLLRMAIIILVDVVFFVVHWKLAKRARESVNA